jgi:hypothetical protein
MFTSFLPAMSRRAQKAKSEELRRWRLHRNTASDLADLAEWMNPVIQGWMNYYGMFYRSELYDLLRRINTYLMRWARRKYKRLRAFKRFKRWWDRLLKRAPNLFAHWKWMPYYVWTR